MIVDSSFVPQVRDFYEQVSATIPEHEHETWDWIIDNLAKDQAGFHVSVLLDDRDEIEILNCSYTINRMWNLPSNSLPEWVIGLTRGRARTSLIRTYDLEEMMWPVIRRMEAKGRTAFYMARRVPKFVDWSNVERYALRAHPKIGNFYRYSASVQCLLETPDDLETLPNLYKRLAPPEWSSNKKMAIIRHELKYNYRGQ